MPGCIAEIPMANGLSIILRVLMYSDVLFGFFFLFFLLCSIQVTLINLVITSGFIRGTSLRIRNLVLRRPNALSTVCLTLDSALLKRIPLGSSVHTFLKEKSASFVVGGHCPLVDNALEKSAP